MGLHTRCRNGVRALHTAALITYVVRGHFGDAAVPVWREKVREKRQYVTRTGLFLTSKNMISKTLTFDFDHLAFSASATSDFHWQLWCLVSRLYSKIHVSSPVMTLWSKSGSVWRCSMMSWHTCIWCSFWSVSSLGTIFGQTFRMRGGVNKSMWNRSQWLQEAKITVIYSQDTMLDGNTIRLSLFRP